MNTCRSVVPNPWYKMNKMFHMRSYDLEVVHELSEKKIIVFDHFQCLAKQVIPHRQTCYILTACSMTNRCTHLVPILHICNIMVTIWFTLVPLKIMNKLIRTFIKARMKVRLQARQGYSKSFSQLNSLCTISLLTTQFT